MADNSFEEPTVFDRSAKILDTSLTFGWLEKTLQGCLKTISTLTSCKATRIGVGQGFLSYIIHLEMKWLQGTKQMEELPEDLILKVPTTNTFENMDKVFDLDSESKSGQAMKDFTEQMDAKGLVRMAHQCECEMYRLMSPWHKELRMPKCYYQEMISDESPGAIIMEYLGDKGVARSLVQPLNVEALFQVADAFATLHSWCLKNRNMWDDNPHLRSGFGNMMLTTEEQATKNIELTVDILKEYSMEKFDPLADRLWDFGYALDDLKHVYNSAHDDLHMPSVLVHGDLWITNMMFKKEAASEGNVHAIIDWQTVHPGCAAEDFARLLTSSVTKEVRREHTDAVLKRYYDTLSSKFEDGNPGFTYETLMRGYRKIFHMSVIMVIGMFPFIAGNKAMCGDEDPIAAAAELMDRAHALLEDAVAILDEK